METAEDKKKYKNIISQSEFNTITKTTTAQIVHKNVINIKIKCIQTQKKGKDYWQKIS